MTIKQHGGIFGRNPTFNNRHVVMPDADLTAEDADVAVIAGSVFTDAAKAAYAATQVE